MGIWQQVKRTITQRPAVSGTREDQAAPRSRFRWIRGRRYLEGSVMIGPKDASTDQFLDFQHYIVRHVLGGSHQSPLDRPAMILDVGCGTGRWAAEMAAEFPGARVLGLDLVMPENVEPLLLPLGPLAANVSFVEGDATRGLPFHGGTFDYAHMQLLFSEIPAVHWPGIIHDMVRVVRPGGWVECVEPAEAIHDPSPAYALTSSWVAELCRRRGMDPDLGPKLGQLLWGAGLQNVMERAVPSFPDVRLTRERRLWQAQSIGVLETIFRDPILDAGLTTPTDFDNVMRAVRAEFEAGQHANSDLLCVAYGQRPW
jgi:ubiquinone/menaquinone biosynthesis C-methylase UbiE